MEMRYKISPYQPERSRPKRIQVEFIDPLDDQLLCSSDWPYNIRKAADGWYSKEIKRLTAGFKNMFSDILQGRDVKTITTIYR